MNLRRGLLPRSNPQRRRREEREFLPAALEIIETPVSPAGRIMMAVVGLLVLVAVAWACIGTLDVVATANGKLIPSGKIKLIQPLEIGVVRRIAVSDGSHVAKGDMLVELDPTTTAADRDRVKHDLMQAELDIARQRAFLSGGAANFVPPDGVDPTLVEEGRRQLLAQLAQRQAKLDGLEKQIAAKTAERDQASVAIEKFDESLPLLKQKAEVYQKLREGQLASLINKLDSERQYAEAKHDRAGAVHQREGAEAQIEALRQQRAEIDSTFRQQALDEMRKTLQYAAEQRQDLIKAAQRTSLQELRAPVAGTVEQLSIHTIGGVVQPAQTLMVVVPDDSKLEVEAMLPNRDAGFVHAGQPVELKIEAFTYTRYGLLHGEVRTVSRDALSNERDAPDPERAREAARSGRRDTQAPAPSEAAYVARISVAESTVQTEQGTMKLEAGMTVTAEIKTGQRAVISYLLSPFMRYRHEALRER
jgi:hemolysin D